MRQDRIWFGLQIDDQNTDGSQAGTPMPMKKSIDYDTARRIACRLPGVEESTSYGTPACKVKGKLFLRFHQDGDSLVVRIDPAEREILMEADPETFYITDHYLNYPWILVRLASVREDQLSELLTQAWRLVAPRRLVANFYGFAE